MHKSCLSIARFLSGLQFFIFVTRFKIQINFLLASATYYRDGIWIWWPSIDFSLCSGSEYLLQIVHGTIPSVYFEAEATIPAAQLAVHILDYLYKQLDEVCLVQGGEVVTNCPSAHYIFVWICLLVLAVKWILLISGGSLSNGTVYVCWELIAIYRVSWFLAFWRITWWSFWWGNCYWIS